MSDEAVVSSESEAREPGSTRAEARDLGDVTGQTLRGARDLGGIPGRRSHAGTATVHETVGGEGDGVDYYRFTVSESCELRLALMHLADEAVVYLEDASGSVLSRSMALGRHEAVIRTLAAGTYYVRVESESAGELAYELVYGVLHAHASYEPPGSGWYVGHLQAMEPPTFESVAYGFALPEHVDGGSEGVFLGAVRATDPSGEPLHYAIVGGNESGLFGIDGETGALYYVGSGEDYEGVDGPYELTVRVWDGRHTVDATVTVTVGDVAEAPAFGETSYAFELAENVDGSETRVSLGTVAAEDPDDGDTVSYAIAAGNELGRFAIDASSGELSYVGTGENHEGVSGPYALTVRAAAGTHTVDAAVTVTVTDVPEGVSEPSGGDLSQDRSTKGEVLVGQGPVTGRIETVSDQDWFAVELEAGRPYVIEQRGRVTGDGTLEDPYFFGVYDAEGRRYADTTAPDGGVLYNSRLVFTAPEDGRYYVAAAGGGWDPWGLGTYELEVCDAGAPEFESRSYAFALAENVDGSETRVSLGSVTATDPDERAVRYRLADGNESGRFAIDASTGALYYVGSGEDFESETKRYELTVSASAGEYASQATVVVTVTDEADGPAFEAASYTFALAENVDGSETRVSLGTVSATGPDGAAVGYELADGNESGRFELDEQTGELFYVGSGEDYESDPGPHTLTVRASAGTQTVDTTVTVTVTDEAEAPEFEAQSYAFVLAENVDGSTARVPLGSVTATDPEGAAVRYELVSGNESGRFEIDASSGALSYIGPGEDYESATKRYELTVRAGDGTNTAETTVAINVTDVQGESEPAGGDLPAGRETDGVVEVDEEPVSGSLRSRADRDWFEVTLAPGHTYAFSVEGGTPSDGPTPVIRTLRDANGDVVPGVGGRATVGYTTDAGEAEAVYYVEVGSEGGPVPGTSAARGLGPRSAGTRSLAVRSVEIRNSPIDLGTRYDLKVDDITVRLDDDDDFTSDISTAGEVAVGASVEGVIGTAGDRDWFKVSLVAGKTYRIDLEGVNTGAGTLSDPYLRGIYDSTANLIDDTTDNDGGWRKNSRILFTADESGFHYVSAGAHESLTGTYRLSVTEIPDDYTARTDTVGRVVVGESTTGDIQYAGDQDWFAVDLVVGKTYEITLRGESIDNGTPLHDPYLAGVHDAEGNLIPGTTSDWFGGGTDAALTYRATATATHFVAASSGSGIGAATGTYRLGVRETSDRYTAGTDTAGVVPVGGSTQGVIDYVDDRDWFAVELSAERTYRIDLVGGPRSRGGIENPAVLLGAYDKDANAIADATVDTVGSGSQMVLTASDSAKYFVEVKPVEGQLRTIVRGGKYQLSVTDITLGVPDPHTAGTDTAGRVVVGDSVTGDINHQGDRDWFAVDLVAGRTYRIDLLGWSDDADGHRYGTLQDPYLRGVHDARANLVADTADDNGGWSKNSSISYSPTESGTHYVAAGGAGNHTGTYTLSVTDVSGSVSGDLLDTTDTSGRVEVGRSMTGTIDFRGDRDWFAVNLEAGKMYLITIESSGSDDTALGDTFLRGIYDADGNLIDGTSDDNGGYHAGGFPAGRYKIKNFQDSELAFTAPADATYYVSVSAGPVLRQTGTYKLGVTEIVGDFSSDTDTVGRVVVGSPIDGRFDYPGDRDWIAVSLEEDKAYRFDLQGSTTGPRAEKLNSTRIFGVFDSKGDPVDGATFTGELTVATLAAYSQAVYVAEADADYFVSAGTWDDRGRGAYTLSVSEIVDDYADDTGTAGAVTVGSSTTGFIHYGEDHDWFAVSLEAETTYRFRLAGHGEDPGVETFRYPYVAGIFDTNGAMMAGTTGSVWATGVNSEGPPRRSEVDFTPASTGTYYVSAAAFATHYGTYTLSVTDLTDIAADTSTTGEITVGDSTRGYVNSAGDEDWYAVELVEGKTYRFDLKGSPSGDGTLLDPFLRGLYDSEAVLVAGTTDDDGGTGANSRMVFTATGTDPNADDETVTYYVSAGAGGNGTGTYTLSVEEATDIAADIGTTGEVTLGDSTLGYIDSAGDEDWYAVELVEGKTYRFDLKGSPSGDGTLPDPFLRGIYDSESTLVDGTTDDDGGTGANSRVEFTATGTDPGVSDETVTYYVSAGADGDGTGTYTLSVEEVM